MKLTDIQVDRYGPLPRFTHECQENFEVFYGPNESGKTLLLEAVLKLLDPDIDTAIPRVSRVEESPTGYVVVETNGTEQKLGDETVLRDLIDLSPSHLRNIFVIRDSDLQLRNEHDFYDSVTQQIGDLHTTEIDAIQSRLVDRGRLTSVKGRGLSNAREYDKAETVRNGATALARNIEEYLDEVERSDIANVEREFVAVKTELKQCKDALESQKAAEILATHRTLTDRLSAFREAIDKLDEDISHDTLDRLEQLDREIDHAELEIEELKHKRDSLRQECTELESSKESLNAELAPLNTRSDDVKDIERALDSFRETHNKAIGVSRGMRFARYIALIAIGLGGISAILGSTIASVLLIVVGGVAAIWYGMQHRSVAANERERERVVQQAQDAGFDVTTVEEIGTAISEFRAEMASLQARCDDIGQEIELKNNLLKECNEQLRAKRQERRENREEKQETLQETTVSTVDAYRERVDEQDTLDRQREKAAQSLEDTLGTPTDSDQSAEAKIGYWTSELDAMVTDIDEAVSADDYSSDRLAALREEYDQLKARQDNLSEQLDKHERQLREFDNQIQDLASGSFVEEPVRLSARSVEGLREAVHDLERLVEQIDRDADIAREALEIFDDIQATEEQKITDLFGDESRASTVFQQITDGRYTGVSYNAEQKVLQVHRDDRDILRPDQLSHGTTEQLYFSARIGLAEKLLNSEPGFFLMDDAFLPADHARLREGFKVLQTLAENGWQILYFTAKDEVGNDLVEQHGLRCRTFDSLV